jgi:hypothetical protein
MQTETICDDGIDNDGDGLTDCADPDCLHKTCVAGTGDVCCGTSCVDITADPNNCGGCGMSCGNNSCNPVFVLSTPSGACTCGIGASCPLLQKCGPANLCACQMSSQCAAGETCSPSFLVCFYPP